LCFIISHTVTLFRGYKEGYRKFSNVNILLYTDKYPTLYPFYTPRQGDEMALTALEIKAIICPEDKKQIKLFDGNRLFLLVNTKGSKR